MKLKNITMWNFGEKNNRIVHVFSILFILNFAIILYDRTILKICGLVKC